MAHCNLQDIAARIAFIQRTPARKMTPEKKRELIGLKRAYIAATRANGERLTFAPWTGPDGKGRDRC